MAQNSNPNNLGASLRNDEEQPPRYYYLYDSRRETFLDSAPRWLITAPQNFSFKEKDDRNYQAFKSTIGLLHTAGGQTNLEVHKDEEMGKGDQGSADEDDDNDGESIVHILEQNSFRESIERCLEHLEDFLKSIVNLMYVILTYLERLLLNLWFIDYNLALVDQESFQRRLFNQFFVSSLFLVIGTNLVYEAWKTELNLSVLNDTMSYLVEHIEDIPKGYTDLVLDPAKILAFEETGDFNQWDGQDIITFTYRRAMNATFFCNGFFFINFGVFFVLLVSFHFMNKFNREALQLWFKLHVILYWCGIGFTSAGWYWLSVAIRNHSFLRMHPEFIFVALRYAKATYYICIVSLALAAFFSCAVNCKHYESKESYYYRDEGHLKSVRRMNDNRL